MARKPRIHYPGAVYHVILRGNGGQDIFFARQDRARFYLLLQEGVEKFGHRIHALCCMTNHVHLAIQVADISLSKIMQNVSFRYTRYINKRKKRTGHLFQGRYKALLIDADSYLLELVRYIHLNPVRAGIVSKPDEYPWSGHRAYLGTEKIPWLTTEWVLGQFASHEKTANRLYADFVLQSLGNDRQLEFHHGSHEGRILGDDSFAEKVVSKARDKNERKVTLEQIIEAVCRAYDLLPPALAEPGRKRRVAEPRAVVSLLVLEAEGLTLTNFASYLNRDLSGLSQAAGRLQKALQNDHALAKKLDKIKRDMQQTPTSQA